MGFVLGISSEVFHPFFLAAGFDQPFLEDVDGVGAAHGGNVGKPIVFSLTEGGDEQDEAVVVGQFRRHGAGCFFQIFFVHNSCEV
jgi:hypothetical protein